VRSRLSFPVSPPEPKLARTGTSRLSPPPPRSLRLALDPGSRRGRELRRATPNGRRASKWNLPELRNQAVDPCPFANRQGTPRRPSTTRASPAPPARSPRSRRCPLPATSTASQTLASPKQRRCHRLPALDDLIEAFDGSVPAPSISGEGVIHLSTDSLPPGGVRFRRCPRRPLRRPPCRAALTQSARS
jgi:hypothetical protein